MRKKNRNENILKAEKKAKVFVEDFKNFAVKGNIIDMATGVVIGTAFTKIVNSLVTEIITPGISLLTGKIELKNLFIPISHDNFASIAEAKAAGVATINYGMFLSSIIDFLIVSLTIFLFLRYTFKKRKKETEVIQQIISTKECPYCLSSIPEKAIKCAFCTENLDIENAKD